MSYSLITSPELPELYTGWENELDPPNPPNDSYVFLGRAFKVLSLCKRLESGIQAFVQTVFLLQFSSEKRRSNWESFWTGKKTVVLWSTETIAKELVEVNPWIKYFLAEFYFSQNKMNEGFDYYIAASLKQNERAQLTLATLCFNPDVEKRMGSKQLRVQIIDWLHRMTFREDDFLKCYGNHFLAMIYFRDHVYDLAITHYYAAAETKTFAQETDDFKHSETMNAILDKIKEYSALPSSSPIKWNS